MNESVRKKIELRAYDLFLKRGGKHGHHAEDWARAEKEVLDEINKASSSGVAIAADLPKKARTASSSSQGKKTHKSSKK
jgi:hypothetical protein